MPLSTFIAASLSAVSLSQAGSAPSLAEQAVRAFDADEAYAQEAVSVLVSIEGLSPRPARGGGSPSHEWDVAGSRDYVRLVRGSDISGALINLEARGRQ